jgi:hypothetical protein
MRWRAAGSMIIAALALVGSARADDAPSPNDPAHANPGAATDPAPARSGTRAGAVGWGATSGVLAASGAFIPIPAPYVFNLQLSASAPILASSTSDAAWSGAVQGGLIAGTVGLAFARRADPTWKPYYATVGSLSLHHAFYAAWLSYRDARERASSPAWNDDWRSWSTGELVFAPFSAKNYAHHVTGAALSVEGALFGIVVAGNALATNGRPISSASSFARDVGLGVVAAWDAGVTEEAFFRGVLYEELRVSMPKWPARIIDMTVFTAAHVPGELAADESATLIGFGIFTRALGALLFEIAYDEGGLPASVTLHAVWDTVAFVGSALAGVHPFGGNMFAPLGSSFAGSSTSTSTSRSAVGQGTVIVPVLSRSF